MLRLAAASRALREAFPAAADPLAVAVTHLGGVTVLMLGLSLLYWLTDRRATALVVAYAFGAYAVVLGLKWLFVLPRPPEAVWVIATDGYGFPSGHATAAAVVYGGIALEFDRVTERWQQAALGGVAVAVACSRVVLGVHFLSDILAGLVLGAALLAAFHYGADGDPTRSFAAAGVLGVAALSTTWGDPGTVAEVLGIVGACVGGALATWDMDAIPRFESAVEAVALVVVGLAFLVALQVAGEAFTGLLAGVDDAVLVGGLVLMPRIVGRAWRHVPVSGGARA